MPNSEGLGLSRRSATVRYGVAVASVAAAAGAAWLLAFFLEAAPLVSLFVCALMFAAWYGGAGPGLAATLLATLAFDYFFVAPLHSFAFGADELPRIALFAAAALFVVWLGASQRRTSDALRQARDALQGAVARLEGANRALQAENAERLQAERRTREAERTLQATIDTIPVLVASYRPDGRRDFVNRPWQEFTGLAPRDVLGKDWSIAVHPDDVEAGERSWRESRATGRPLRRELRLRRADGVYRWYVVHRVPLRNEAGEVVRWYSVGDDIEDRKCAEEALRLSEAHLARTERELRLTLDLIPTLAWHAAPDGAAEYLNKRWLDYTGLSLEQALGWNWQAAIHPEDRPRLFELWREIREAGRLTEVEARLRRFDGVYRWFLFRPAPLHDESGKVVRWYGTNTDIEDRKRAEDALRRSEAYLAEAQRLSQTGSFGWKVATGEIVWSNEAYRIMGFELSVRPTPAVVLQRIHPEDRARVQHLMQRAQHGADLYDHESRLLMDDGRIKHIRVRAHRVAYDSGEQEIVGALTDVTAAYVAEEALQAARAELAHASRVAMLGEMSASIAHEVSQPVAAIVANSQAGRRWLDRELPAIGEADAALARIVDDAHRATRVIQRIRALAKKADPEMAPLDLNDVVGEALALVRREALDYRVALRPQLAPGLPAVRGDRIQLQQVIINLAINGMQAMVAVPDGARDLVVRTGQVDDGHLVVAVEDAGIGIESQNLDRLFRAFYTTKPGGMGMGLSISRSIIESHGGTIRASRNAGPGMTFQFTVPAAPIS